MEQHLIETLTKLEANTGFKWNYKNAGNDLDGTVDILINNNKEHFTVELKKELREYQLPKLIYYKQIYKPLMVIAERIFPAMKEKLRNAEINYLDGAGNIYIRTKRVTIWLDGFKHEEPEKPVTNRAFTKTGLKMVFYLMLHREAINMPQRILANATGVALGNVKNVISGLEEAGYVLQIGQKRQVLQNKRALLERWIAGYGETLKPSLHIGNFKLPTGRPLEYFNNNLIEPGKTIWGGEPAGEWLTGYLNPEIWTIYTVEKRNQAMVKWRLIPATEGPIQAYDKFWQDDAADVHPYAPELLVYADLLLTGDPRCIETARMIYDKHLKDEFGEY
ncbi:type IV toxin-antitoxin system AbiEi family antitoxin [Pedobacter miscanthi]|uniref:type IV toxin-antitoxin system AbiEi family antitoxin n=1 Tax=Pedobacter miscanthi TaxID=2259170 RepID=UPI0029303ACA|nr:type IV toxin-antitoxin system AbiEi family antitoxin [Pedobacter miscanthi]